MHITCMLSILVYSHKIYDIREYYNEMTIILTINERIIVNFNK